MNRTILRSVSYLALSTILATTSLANSIDNDVLINNDRDYLKEDFTYSNKTNLSDTIVLKSMLSDYKSREPINGYFLKCNGKTEQKPFFITIGHHKAGEVLLAWYDKDRDGISEQYAAQKLPSTFPKGVNPALKYQNFVPSCNEQYLS